MLAISGEVSVISSAIKEKLQDYFLTFFVLAVAMFLNVNPRFSFLQTRIKALSMAHLKRNLADLSSSDSDSEDLPTKSVKTETRDKLASKNGENNTIFSGELKVGSTISNGSVNKRGKEPLTTGAKSKTLSSVTTSTKNEEKSSAASHWTQGLIASMKDPSLLLCEDDFTVIIKDKYPKAKHHYLIMPKDVSVRSLHVLSFPKHSDLFNHIKRSVGNCR